MRGKPGVDEGDQGLDRIIPARAGQTGSYRRAYPPRSDHPRACGANTSRSRFDLLECGSSPRVRGKLASLSIVIVRLRIIPARAGQTMPIYSTPVLSTDHPRACGANEGGRTVRRTIRGSSPRVRGKRCACRLRDMSHRIIPARAGQTHCRPYSGLRGTDHPRACGANRPIIA